MDQLSDSLAAEFELALAYAPRAMRDRFRTALALDQRLGRIATATTEPIFGQMRLAWWRDMLAKPVDQRPRGDAVLDAIGEHWRAEEDAIRECVDGWETIVASDTLEIGDLQRCLNGRAAPLIMLFKTDDLDLDKRIGMAIGRYFCADLAHRFDNDSERELAIEYGLGMSGPDLRLPRSARPLAVLEALAIRALKNGARPLMEGRGASFTALKAGIFGR